MYTINKYEEVGATLFVEIKHTELPITVGHFLTEEERLDVKSTLEKLVAKLYVKADDYQMSPVTISKLNDVKDMPLDEQKIELEKQRILATR